MGAKTEKKLRWPVCAEDAQYMRMRQAQNRARCANNKHENWMADKLKTTGRKWTRQAQWGFRLFDFWCAELGIAIEVDGPEHNAAYDGYRDEYNYARSGILVLRVRNGDEDGARIALEVIGSAETWKERREKLGVNERRRSKKKRSQ